MRPQKQKPGGSATVELPKWRQHDNNTRCTSAHDRRQFAHCSPFSVLYKLAQCFISRPVGKLLMASCMSGPSSSGICWNTSVIFRSAPMYDSERLPSAHLPRQSANDGGIDFLMLFNLSSKP